MKKVLILTYYWPPAGGPGVQRVLKFAKYLPAFGWEPIILTVDNGNYPALDHTLVNDIPKDLKVYTTNTLEPFVLYNKIRGASSKDSLDTFTLTKSDKSLSEKVGAFIRKSIFIPDARMGWKHFAVKKGADIVEKENIDMIFSSSPPHSLQLAAKSIASKTGKPWVGDFRDPWSKAFWLDADQRTGYVYNRNVNFEKSVLNKLDAFVTVSKGIVELFNSQCTNLTDKSHVIYNGFDEADFPSKEYPKNKIFTIRYIGTLAKSQNPIHIFDHLVNNSNVKLEFWGKFDPAIRESVIDYGLSSCVSFHPYVSHNDAIELMRTSDLLLLVIPFENSKGILTGKLYEYIATGNPILGLGPKDSEAKAILEENFFGQYFSDNKGISSFINDQIDKWKENTSQNSDKDILKYSRQSATKQLADIFNKLV